MREVLHELHQHRSLTALDIEKAFDTQQVRPTQLHQRIHGTCKYRPWHRRFFGQDKTADTITVSGLRNEWVALVGSRFDEALRIDFTVDRLQDLRPGIEGAQSRGQRGQRTVAGNIGLRDDETVGEYRLPACLGRPFKCVSCR